MNTRRICVLHRYPIMDALGTNPALLNFLSNLEGRRMSVRFVSLRARTPVRVPIPHVSIFEIPITIQRSNTFLKFVQSLVYFLFIAVLALGFRTDKSLDLVYCDDSLPFLGWIVKFSSGKKVIIRLGDLQTGYLFEDLKPKIMLRAVHSVERWTWKKMDGLIPISAVFEEYLVKCHMNPRKIVTVPECVDTDLFVPTTSQNRVNDNRMRIRLIHHGILEKSKGLERLLSYIETYKSGERIQTIIIGDGTARKYLMNRFARLVSDGRLTFSGWQPFEHIPEIIGRADIGLVSRKLSFANNLVLTAGMLQYLACGVPVLVPDLASMKALANSATCGLVYQSESDFHTALDRLLNDPKLRMKLGSNGRNTMINNYSKVMVGERLANAVIALGYEGSS